MKRILVPTDFSECAGNAAEVALQIAKKTGAELHFIHSVHVPVDWAHPDMLTAADAELPPSRVKDLYPETKAVMGRAEHQLDGLVKRAEKAGVTAFREAAYNFASDHIVAYAAARKADLIVMGSHGAGGLREFFIGSNTQKVLRLAACPVLVIKNRHEQLKVKNLVFASNFYGEAERSFAVVKEFAALFGSTIHLLKVITPAEFDRTSHSRKVMEDFAKKMGLTGYTVNIWNDTSVEDGVQAFSEEAGADLLVMETHGRRGLSHLLNGSIAEVVANHAGLPVLTLKVDRPDVKYGVIFPEVRRKSRKK